MSGKKIKLSRSDSMRGGKRPNAGAKPINGTAKKARGFWVSDVEYKELKNYLQKLRAKEAKSLL